MALASIAFALSDAKIVFLIVVGVVSLVIPFAPTLEHFIKNEQPFTIAGPRLFPKILVFPL
jgi:hypothetical protein